MRIEVALEVEPTVNLHAARPDIAIGRPAQIL
jgi:hypothetical protein